MLALQIIQKIDELNRKRNNGSTERMKARKILLVAGEVSGDLHGSYLVEAIHRIDPEIQFFGVGGRG